MQYHGSCHCGKVAYDVEGEIDSVLDCNCSMCKRRGGLLWFVPADKFQLRTEAAGVGTYTFNKHKLQHHFCRVCGISPYSEGSDGKGNPMVAVNARCLDEVDLDTLQVKKFDGAKL